MSESDSRGKHVDEGPGDGPYLFEPDAVTMPAPQAVPAQDPSHVFSMPETLDPADWEHEIAAAVGRGAIDSEVVKHALGLYFQRAHFAAMRFASLHASNIRIQVEESAPLEHLAVALKTRDAIAKQLLDL